MRILLCIAALGLGAGAAAIEDKLSLHDLKDIQIHVEHKAQMIKFLAFDDDR